eukprot:g4636.t1
MERSNPVNQDPDENYSSSSKIVIVNNNGDETDDDGCCAVCCGVCCCCCPCAGKTGEKRKEELRLARRETESNGGGGVGCFGFPLVSIFCCCAVGKNGTFQCASLLSFLLVCVLVGISCVTIFSCGGVMIVACLGVYNEFETIQDVDGWLNIIQGAGDNPFIRKCPGVLVFFQNFFKAFLLFIVLCIELAPLGCNAVSKRVRHFFPGNFYAGLFYVFVGVQTACIDIGQTYASIVRHFGKGSADIIAEIALLGPIIIFLCGIWNMTLGKALGGPRYRLRSYRKGVGL